MKKFLTLCGLILLSGCESPEVFENIIKTDPPLVLETPIEMSYVSPKSGSTDVEGLVPLNFLWNEPVLVLQNHEAAKKFIEARATLTPAHPGEWRTLGATGISFQPKEPWPASTNFELQFDPTLALNVPYSFSTPRLKIDNFRTSDLIAREPLTVEFNQKVDITSFEENLVIWLDEERKTVLDFDIKYGQTKTDLGKEKTDKTVLELQPRENWEEGKSYTFVLNPGSYATEGNLPTEEAIEKEFKAALAFSVTKFQAPKFHHYNGQIQFSAPVSSDVLAAHFEMTPALSTEAMEAYLETWAEAPYESRYFYLSPPEGSWDPREKFTLTLKSGLTDIYDRELSEDSVINFKTTLEDHFKPVYWPRSHTAFAPDVTLRPMFMYGGAVKGVNVSFMGETKRYELESSNEVRQAWTLDLAADFPALLGDDQQLKAGDYKLKLEVEMPGRNRNLEYETRFFVSDFTVEIKEFADDRFQFFARPYPEDPGLPENFDMEVFVGDWQTERHQQTLQNVSNGVEVAVPENQLKTVVVQAGNKTGYGSTRFNQGINPWDASVEFGDWRYSEEFSGVMFTDRPLYKPGQKVFYKGFLRELELFGKNFPLKDTAAQINKDYRITLYDPEYNEVEVLRGKIEKGSFDGTITLPEEARLGQYRLSFTLAGDANQEGLSLEAPFWIQEYRKPNFLLSSKFSSPQALPKEPLEVSVDARYAFGGPIANRPLDYTVTLFGSEPCRFWCWGPEPQKDKVITSGNAVLDETGKWTLPLDLKNLDLGEDNWNLLTLNATVDVSDAEQSSTEVSIPFYRADLVMTLQGVPSFFVPGKPETISGVVENLAGEVQTEAKVEMKIFKTKWVRNDRQNADGNFYGEWESVDELATTLKAKTNDRGQFEFEFESPAESGQYFFEFSTSDNRRRTESLKHHFWISGGNLSRVRENDNNKILWLFPDKDNYQIGERAEVFAPNPEFKVSQAHVTLERGEILETLELEIDQGTLSFVVEDWMAPNIFVSVVLEGLDAEGERKVKWGAVPIKIEDPSHNLTVVVTPEKGIYRPGEEVQLNVKTEINGVGHPAEVAIAVVDQTLLALKSRVKIDLLESLVGSWPLGVSTYHTLANFMSKADMEEVMEQAEAVMALMDMGFGGGGGKGDDFKPRGDFRDTAAFMAKVETGSSGAASVNFTLPDNLTTWNVFAAAASLDNAFGMSEGDFQVTLPLLISELVPNFLQAGDEIDLGLLIHRDNTKKEIEPVTVQLNLPSTMTVVGAMEKTVDVETEARVYFRVKVASVIEKTPALFGFEIQAPESDLHDAVELERPILPPVQNLSVAELLRVETQTTLTVAGAAEALSSRLKIKVFASLAQYLETLIEVAEKVNYGCAEQRLSLSTALLYQAQLDNQLGRPTSGIDLENLKANRDYIEKAFVPGQGFGFWEGADKANLWVTTQVLEHAQLWQLAGAGFSAEKLETAATWLREEMMRSCETKTSWRCPSGMARLNAGYVLVDYQKLTVNDLVFLDQYTTSLEAKIWWLKTAKKVGSLSPALTKVFNAHLSVVEQSLSIEDRYAFWSETNRSFFSQDERLTALGLEVLLDQEDRLDFTHKIARYLAESEKEFLSGNSSMRVLKALARYVKEVEAGSVGARFTLSDGADAVLLKGNLTDLGQVQTVKQKLNNSDPQTLLLETDKPVLLEVELTDTLPAAEALASARGFWLERETLALEGKEAVGEGLTSLALGENYLVRLKIVSAKPHRQVMLESPIPSGAEIVNFDLDNADNRLAEVVDNAGECSWGWCSPLFQHKEFRYDRARFFIDYLPAGTHEVSFLIRTRLSGEFDLLPAKIEEMYFPEVFATTNGERIEIKSE